MEFIVDFAEWLRKSDRDERLSIQGMSEQESKSEYGQIQKFCCAMRE